MWESRRNGPSTLTLTKNRPVRKAALDSPLLSGGEHRSLPSGPAWMPSHLAPTTKNPSWRHSEQQCNSGVLSTASLLRRLERLSGCVLEALGKDSRNALGERNGSVQRHLSHQLEFHGASLAPARVCGGVSSSPLPRRHYTVEKPCFSSRRSPAGRATCSLPCAVAEGPCDGFPT